MNYALDQFTAEVIAALAATAIIPAGMIELQTPKPNVPADLSFPTFRAAKQLGVKPPDLAQQLAAAIELPTDSLIGEVVAMGPYLNIRLQPERFIARVLNNILHAPDS
jgi:arginyl-tRNA synthetase